MKKYVLNGFEDTVPYFVKDGWEAGCMQRYWAKGRLDSWTEQSAWGKKKKSG